MHVPRCHHQGPARKVGYELADVAIFKVSLDSAKGWHSPVTRCRGDEDKEARITHIVLKMGRT